MKAARRLMFMGLIFSVFIITTVAALGAPIYAIAWGLGLSTGMVLVGGAVYLRDHEGER